MSQLDDILKELAQGTIETKGKVDYKPLAKAKLQYLFREMQIEVEEESLKRELLGSDRIKLFAKKVEAL